MAQTGSRKDSGDAARQSPAPDTTSEQKTVNLSVRLVPVNNADQPIFSNYTAVNATPGVAFLDFAFLEPSLLGALSRLEKKPDSIDGRLVARIALAPDALQNLARQLNQLLQTGRKPAA